MGNWKKHALKIRVEKPEFWDSLCNYWGETLLNCALGLEFQFHRSGWKDRKYDITLSYLRFGCSCALRKVVHVGLVRS